jgi:hypothetical protein
MNAAKEKHNILRRQKEKARSTRFAVPYLYYSLQLLPFAFFLLPCFGLGFTYQAESEAEK